MVLSSSVDLVHKIRRFDKVCFLNVNPIFIPSGAVLGVRCGNSSLNHLSPKPPPPIRRASPSRWRHSPALRNHQHAPIRIRPRGRRNSYSTALRGRALGYPGESPQHLPHLSAAAPSNLIAPTMMAPRPRHSAITIFRSVQPRRPPCGPQARRTLPLSSPPSCHCGLVVPSLHTVPSPISPNCHLPRRIRECQQKLIRAAEVGMVSILGTARPPAIHFTSNPHWILERKG